MTRGTASDPALAGGTTNAESALTLRAKVLQTLLQTLAADEVGTDFEVETRLVGLPQPASSSSEPSGAADARADGADADHAARARISLPPKLANAAGKRRATFLAGRACAHAALEKLGSSVDSIPIGDVGAPVWPRGFVGSISHTNAVAAAIVACSPPIAGIGLDIEEAGGVDDPGMVKLICRPEEDLRTTDPADPARLYHGKLLFVIKEAVYKLHSPLGGAFLDFHDVLVTLDGDRFSAELVDAAKQGAAGALIRGRVLRHDDGFAAIAVSRHPLDKRHRARKPIDE